MKNLFTLIKAKKVALFITAAAFSTITNAQYYTQSSCDFDPMATAGTTLCLSDDTWSGAIGLGFTFDYYGTGFSTAYVGSNGMLSFTSGLGSGCCSGQFLPNATFTNTIFFAQEDLDPNSCIDGDITYYTTGAAGSMIFVLSFVNVPHYPGPEGVFPVTVQLQLHESTGEIKIVTTEYNGDGGVSTMGLNMDGAMADIVPGRNSTAWSAYSECISFMPSTACDVPTGLWVSDVTGTSATLNWDDMGAVDGYQITVRNDDDNTLFARVQSATNSYWVSGLTPGTNYGFKLKTVCTGWTDVSEISYNYYFSTPAKIGSISGVTVYPNPSNGTFSINVNGNEANSYEVNVYNALGQVVYNNTMDVTSNSFTYQINLDHVANGMYQVEMVNGNGQLTYPIVIQK